MTEALRLPSQMCLIRSLNVYWTKVKVVVVEIEGSRNKLSRTLSASNIFYFNKLWFQLTSIYCYCRTVIYWNLSGGCYICYVYFFKTAWYWVYITNDFSSTTVDYDYHRPLYHNPQILRVLTFLIAPLLRPPGNYYRFSELPYVRFGHILFYSSFHHQFRETICLWVYGHGGACLRSPNASEKSFIFLKREKRSSF